MKRKIVMILLVMSMVVSVVGCSKSTSSDTTQQEAQSEDDETHAEANTVSLTEGKYSDLDLNDSYDESSATKITLSSDGITTDGSGVSVSEYVATISAGGTYLVSGTIEDGQIIVNVADKSDVHIVLNGASITCSDSAPIYIKQAGNTVITLADGTQNSVTDSETYQLEDESSKEPNAAIFSKDDLTFNGTGSLTVTGNYNNAIQSKDDLKFVSGTYVITAADDGIVGKDSVSFKDGTYEITAQGDAVKSTNVKESDKGYVMVDGGTFTITAENDGFQAETLLRVNDGTFQITTGGGSANAEQKAGMGMDGAMRGNGGMGAGKQGGMGKRGTQEDSATDSESDTDTTMPEPPSGDFPEGEAPSGEMSEKSTADSTTDASTDTTNTTESSKGFKSYVDLVVEAGTFTIDSADDTLHSNGNVTLDGGTFNLKAGDDGVHADKILDINKVTLTIETSYEGLEGCDININDGDIQVTSSDDGINAVNGDDGDSVWAAEAGKPQGGGMDADDGSLLTISGGTLYVAASGDGLDSNGQIVMTGGTVEVQGPSNGGNGTLDYNGGFALSGGSFIGIGASQMAQTPDDDSEQGYIATDGVSIQDGSNVILKDSSGTVIAQTTSTLAADWICLSSDKVKSGETYTLVVDDAEQTVTAK